MPVIQRIQAHNIDYDITSVQHIYQTSDSGTITITPVDGQIYKVAVAGNDVITVNTTGLTADYACTFQIWIDQPSTAVSFTLPEATWINVQPSTPYKASTRYVFIVRWNGTKLLISYAYEESLA